MVMIRELRRLSLHLPIIAWCLFGAVDLSLAGDQEQTCEILSVEAECPTDFLRTGGSLFAIGRHRMVVDGLYSPKYASIDDRSISLVFESAENRLLFINRHNAAVGEVADILSTMDGRRLLKQADCDAGTAESLACSLLGDGTHKLIGGEQYSGVAYFESDGPLHGRISRAFIFDNVGPGYFDVVVSPSLGCGSLAFVGAVSETWAVVGLKQNKANELLESFARYGTIERELVRQAGFSVIEGKRSGTP